MAARLLVVEDDQEIVSMLRMVLEDAGYEVVSLVRGDRVVGAVATYRPDAVLLDLMLPKLNGVEVLKELTLLPQRPPVLVLSAYAGQAKGEEAIAPWPDTVYLAKPFEQDVLLATVARLVSKGEA